MKGVELPINILVIVAIAVIVLLGLIALYFIGFGPFAAAAGLEGQKNSACRALVQANNCAVDTKTIKISVFDANKDNTTIAGETWDWADPTADSDDNLAALCYFWYNRVDENSCKQLCNCPGY